MSVPLVGGNPGRRGTSRIDRSVPMAVRFRNRRHVAWLWATVPNRRRVLSRSAVSSITTSRSLSQQLRATSSGGLGPSGGRSVTGQVPLVGFQYRTGARRTNGPSVSSRSSGGSYG